MKISIKCFLIFNFELSDLFRTLAYMGPILSNMGTLVAPPKKRIPIYIKNIFD